MSVPHLPVVQTYHIRSLTTDQGVFDFEGWSAQLVQLGRNEAMVLVSDPQDPLRGIMDVFDFLRAADAREVDPANHFNVVEIVYSISAWSDDHPNVIVSQAFKHKFKSGTTMDSSWRITTRQSQPLFTTDSLNQLLDTRAFPGVVGTQFVS